MTKHKILLADDHKLFGQGLKELLNKQEDFVVEGPFQDPSEIRTELLKFTPKILLLDINLAGINGIELGIQLRKEFPDLGIIMLTMYENAGFLKQSKEAGMDGYLLKDCDTNDLLGGIRKVLNGEKHFVEIKADIFEDEFKKDSFLEQYHLSTRELEILNFIKQGLSNHDIAKELVLSYHTVKTHRKNIYTKLGVSNVAELIEFTARFPTS